MASAIVTGATGILGREIVAELGKEPQRWKTVYALSRSRRDDYPSNVQHISIDLTSDKGDMAEQLKGIEAEYVFFAAYIQKDSEQQNWDANGAMLKNFLDALKMTNASHKIKRVILTTGAKQYGVHLGAVKNPMEESDPWIEGEGRPPNFYYYQQRILQEVAETQGWEWVVTYPNDVLGVVKGNFMNLVTALGIYCAVSKELDGNLMFPGSEEFYTCFDSFTYSPLHASFNLWAATEPRCANQAFNVVNGDVESWQNMWPKLASRFQCHIPRSQFNVKMPEGSDSTIELAKRPPLADSSAERGLEGKIKQSVVSQKIDLVSWSQREDVKNAWTKLVERHDLDEESFENATWGFLGFVLGRNYDLVISMSKARKFGWTGYADTYESLTTCLDQLEEMKVIPRTK